VYYLWLDDEDSYGHNIMIIVITLPLTLTWVNILFIYACYSEGSEKATRGGVNGSQSKFLIETWPIS
jgi:hypothetical protein